MSTLPDTLIITAGVETAVYSKQAIGPPTDRTVIQPMVHFSQRDKRWADFEYDPGYTLGKSGCLITSIAMIGSFYYDGTITPLNVAERLRELGAFSHGLLTKPELINKAWSRLYFGGLINWHATKADLDLVAQELELFDATIIQVLANANAHGSIADNSHFVVLRQLLEHDALIVDPWYGRGKQLSATPYVKSGWSPERAIYGIRRFRITRDD